MPYDMTTSVPKPGYSATFQPQLCYGSLPPQSQARCSRVVLFCEESSNFESSFIDMNILKNNPLIAVGGVAVLAVLAWLAFGFFGIQSAFIDNEVSQASPTFGAEFGAAMELAEENQNTATEGSPEMAGEVQTIFSGNFEDNVINGYDVVGEALVLNDGTEQRFLRLEGFNTPNGPDLKVYLRADNGDFVSLGDLAGNIGDQNYEIPPEVDLTVFNSVDIWCERFSVGFGLANLSPTT